MWLIVATVFAVELVPAPRGLPSERRRPGGWTEYLTGA